MIVEEKPALARWDSARMTSPVLWKLKNERPRGVLVVGLAKKRAIVEKSVFIGNRENKEPYHRIRLFVLLGFAEGDACHAIVFRRLCHLPTVFRGCTGDIFQTRFVVDQNIHGRLIVCLHGLVKEENGLGTGQASCIYFAHDIPLTLVYNW